jgi:hypothetical protein
VPATVSAAGFNLDAHNDKFSTLDWFMILKIANASRNNLTIENIQAEWIGKNNYGCKSTYLEIFETISNKENGDENLIINQLLQRGKSNKRVRFLPIVLQGQSEKFIRVNFSLATYKRNIFHKWLPIYFEKEEIREPQIYEKLLQKAVIKIKLNTRHRPLSLKI